MRMLQKQRAGRQGAQHQDTHGIEHRNRMTGQHIPPPHFWDNLSRIPLIKSALRELDRRNDETQLWRDGLEDSRQSPGDPQRLRVDIISQDIHRFSRNGGPDLSGFRGYGSNPKRPPPRLNVYGQREPRPNMPQRGRARGGRKVVSNLDQGGQDTAVESQDPDYRAGGRGGHRSGRHLGGARRVKGAGASQSHQQGSWEQPTKPSSTRTGPYDPAFMQHLLEFNILPLAYDPLDGDEPEPPDNMGEITAALFAERTSEPADDFRSFRRAYRQASNEEDALNQIDTLQGDRKTLMQSHAVRQKKMMSKLAPLTDGSIAHGNPDRVYGSRAAELAVSARHQLKDLIVPTAEQDFICPNFVFHAKGSNGSASVMRVQAVYDGALAARGMQALWEFGDGSDGIATKDTTRGASDGSDSSLILGPSSQRLTGPDLGLVGHAQAARVAHAITCTWADGVLKIYAIHCEPSSGIRKGEIAGRQAAGAPRYVSTLIGSWIMTDREDQYKEGLVAYRNAMDWAKTQRDMAISHANARVRRRLELHPEGWD